MQKGVELFGGKKGEDEEDDAEQWPLISLVPHFEQYMARKESDPWWEFPGVIDEFNLIRSTKVIYSHWISADETMSAWRPRTTALGGLTNISVVVRKPEPLGKLLLIFSKILFKYQQNRINLFYYT